MRHIVFENESSLKKMLWEISQNSQEKFCARISFFFFFCDFAKFGRTPFLENSTGGLTLIIAVSRVVKGVLANETVNYDSKTKA